ncbi:hypothetical protein ASD54_19605 [Rhizobium sp. Root149]|nr:hypothetical protein ASD54_19605 [Rhizobium sp. Root149]
MELIETTPELIKLLTSQDLRKAKKMNVARSFNNWRKYRQTVNELARMSSRELADMGISRSEIEAVARGSVAR